MPITPQTDSVSLLRLKREAMGTQWELVVPMGTTYPLPWAEKAFSILAKEEGRLSVFIEHSEVARFNCTPPGVWRKLSSQLFALLLRCQYWWDLTDGCLDIAVGRMIEGWGFLKGPARIPDNGEIKVWLAEGGFSRLILDQATQNAKWIGKSGGLNFGAVGKGFGLDQMASALRDSAWPAAMLHGGRSSVVAWGCPLGESNGWRVALMHPRKDSILAEVEIINGAMGTTAATFKHIEFEGRRLGHVLNPKTAWPVTECETVSVLASDATEADALSTAIFVGGPSLAERLTAARNDLGILYLPAQGPARLFGSLAERFHFR